MSYNKHRYTLPQDSRKLLKDYMYRLDLQPNIVRRVEKYSMTPSEELLSLFKSKPQTLVDVFGYQNFCPSESVTSVGVERFSFVVSKSGVLHAYVDNSFVVTSFLISKD